MATVDDRDPDSCVLLVAEKPSVAKALAEALSGGSYYWHPTLGRRRCADRPWYDPTRPRRRRLLTRQPAAYEALLVQRGKEGARAHQ